MAGVVCFCCAMCVLRRWYSACVWCSVLIVMFCYGMWCLVICGYVIGSTVMLLGVGSGWVLQLSLVLMRLCVCYKWCMLNCVGFDVRGVR